MSVTKETTVWCDEQDGEHVCSEWVQFNQAEAGGSVVMARRLARGSGWRRQGDDDICPKHNKRPWDNFPAGQTEQIGGLSIRYERSTTDGLAADEPLVRP